MLDQLQRLAIHPQADLDDLRAGLRLAAGVELDVIPLDGRLRGDPRAATPLIPAPLR